MKSDGFSFEKYESRRFVLFKIQDIVALWVTNLRTLKKSRNKTYEASRIERGYLDLHRLDVNNFWQLDKILSVYSKHQSSREGYSLYRQLKRLAS